MMRPQQNEIIDLFRLTNKQIGRFFVISSGSEKSPASKQKISPAGSNSMATRSLCTWLLSFGAHGTSQLDDLFGIPCPGEAL